MKKDLKEGQLLVSDDFCLLIDCSAFYGYLKALKWLKKRDCPFDARTCGDCAAKGGNLQILKWLRAQKGC